MVYIIGGLPGAGKTTYANDLAKKVNGIVFSTDVWMRDMFWMDKTPNDDHKWAFERADRCERKMVETCIHLAEINVPSILDIGFVNLKWRQKTYKSLDDSNTKFEVHFLEASRPTRSKRVKKRNTEKGETFAGEVTEEMLDFMDNIFNPISEQEMSGKLIMINNE